MTHLLLWVLIIVGPIVSAAAGGYAVHHAERVHWHRLAQTWYDDGRDYGWNAARLKFGTMVPDMVFTQDGTLEAVPPDWQPWPAVDQAFEAARASVGREFAAARASLYLS